FGSFFFFVLERLKDVNIGLEGRRRLMMLDQAARTVVSARFRLCRQSSLSLKELHIPLSGSSPTSSTLPVTVFLSLR
ncbi:UNVERIFIED_CONTAM: hypothetical protein NO986_25360, partial [Comamonas sp. A-3]